MLLVGSDDMSNVGNCGFDIAGHDVDGSQVVDLRQLEQLRLLLIPILLHEVDLRTKLTILTLLLLVGLDQPQLSGHGEVGHRAVDHQLIQSVLEKVLLHGDGIFKVIDGHFGEVHDGADVELVDPVGGLAHPEDRPLARIILPCEDELLLHLLLILLRVLLPIIECVSFLLFQRFVQALQEVIQ